MIPFIIICELLVLCQLIVDELWQEIMKISVTYIISFKGQQPRVGQFSDLYFSLDKQDVNF